MMCRYPFHHQDLKIDLPCGQCMHCRINKKREWTHRIMLESMCHSDNRFVTLTYNDAHLVFNNKDPILHYPDVQKYFKRLRKAAGPFRFYAVGEYGEKSQRPHYHFALFGARPAHLEHLADCWSDDLGPMGIVHVGNLTFDSAAYIAGYVTKKMTCVDDPRLEGRPPEMCRMSRRPGIGALYTEKIAEQLGPHLDKYLDSHGDVPRELLHGRRRMALGRYMVSKLRKHFDVEELGAKKSQEWVGQMQAVQAAIRDTTHPRFKAIRAQYDSEKLERSQRRANAEARSAIFTKEKKL